MDYIKTGILAIVIALAVFICASFIFKGAPSVERVIERVGGVPGVSVLPSSQYPTANLILATSTLSNSTLATADIDEESWIAMTLTQANGTLTFPASTSFPGINNPGDSRVIWVRNATTSAAVRLTIAGNTGTILKRAASSTAELVGDTDAKNSARIEAVRLANTDIVLYLTKYED